MSYHIVAGAFRGKQMLIKYSNVYQTKDIKDASVLINMVYTLSFMVVMPFAEADKAKKFKSGQSEAWL
jgi:hypothetical protein